jgi:hypothetical protein
MQPFSTARFCLHAYITAFKNGGQRSRLNRGHSEVTQLVKVIELGGRQNIQGRKSGHNILSWSSLQSDGAYPRRSRGLMRHFNRFFIGWRVGHRLRTRDGVRHRYRIVRFRTNRNGI